MASTGPPDVLLDLDLPPRPAGPPPRQLNRRRALCLLLAVVGVAATVTQLTPTPIRPVGEFEPILAEHVPWGSFAGTIEDTDLYLVVLVDTRGAAVAYACDGVSESLWLAGRSDGATLSLRPGTDPPDTALTATMTATLTTTAATGGLWVGGIWYPFSLARTGRVGGLFAAEATVAGVRHHANWIVLDAHRQRGVLTVGDRVVPAPRLPAGRPATIRIGDAVLGPIRMDRLTPKWGRLPVAAVRAAAG